ncbi:YmfQ family protein [Jiella pelagia]|uniref:YmfQ family protein n=1 Tax=Jiella pelagia TaxID=2986949 RepID=UPI0038B3167F
MARVLDYTRALQAMLPPGGAWTREPDSNLSKLLTAMADTLARLDDRVSVLLQETDPRVANELLADWERITIADDECGAGLDTLQARRAAVAARLAQIGGQSPAYFISLASLIGFTVTITEFRPFRAGYGAAGDPVYSEEYALTWRINAPEETETPFRVGQSAVGERLVSWGNERLECTLNRVKPAHTTLLFGYGA